MDLHLLFLILSVEEVFHNLNVNTSQIMRFQKAKFPGKFPARLTLVKL